MTKLTMILGTAFVAMGLVAATACSDDSSSGSTTPKEDASTDASSATTGDPIADGKTLMKTQLCFECHGDNLAGSDKGLAPQHPYAFPKNLTPDPDTGIKDWTDDQITKAVTTGIDDEGESLCVMPVYDKLTADEVKAIIAYMRSVPPVKNEIPEMACADGGDVPAPVEDASHE